MLKFVVLLTHALTAIPKTFGEIELPPLTLECLEDLENLLPKGVKVESECRENNSVGGERDNEGYDSCLEEWENSSDVITYVSKCLTGEEIYTEAEVEELGKRYDEIYSKFRSIAQNETQN